MVTCVSIVSLKLVFTVVRCGSSVNREDSEFLSTNTCLAVSNLAGSRSQRYDLLLFSSQVFFSDLVYFLVVVAVIFQYLTFRLLCLGG
jgi:hypothetical protein